MVLVGIEEGAGDFLAIAAPVPLPAGSSELSFSEMPQYAPG